MDTKKVNTLLQEALEENSHLFLIDLSIGTDNAIRVIVDGDQGVPLSECIRISRHIEHNLDREAEDFSLEVTTPSITDALVDARQYNKNLGRVLKVKTGESKYEGKLTAVDDEQITLEWKAREPKPVGKGKITVEKKMNIPLEEIKEAKVKIIF